MTEPKGTEMSTYFQKIYSPRTFEALKMIHMQWWVWVEMTRIGGNICQEISNAIFRQTLEDKEMIPLVPEGIK